MYARWGTIVWLGIVASGFVAAAEAEEAPRGDRIEAIERQLERLQQELRELKAARQREAEPAKAAPAPPAAPAAEPPATAAPGPEATRDETRAPFGTLLDGRVKLGAYGSVRYEGNTLQEIKNTFTLRRLVVTGDANITDRLRSYFEVEFERFTSLEVERSLAAEQVGLRRGFRIEQAIEGRGNSEISLEQAWVQYEVQPWLRFQGGMLLVPVGRFNIRHDDNQWDLPRRSLVDRGVSVLPVPAAWPEVGMGFNGDIPAGPLGKFDYRLYVMNGVTLDTETETVARFGRAELETEVKLFPSRGTANLDVKGAKAVSGRLAWSPLLGQEIAASFYTGRYTPRLLADKNLLSWSVDGKATLSGFEVEAEYVNTYFGAAARVASDLAQKTLDREIESGTTPLNATIEFELARLASRKSGYWVELRYPFWPAAWSRSFIGRHFDNPLLVPVLRMEQAWLKGLVRNVDFASGVLTSFTSENRRIYRITPGLALRLTPLVRFQLAYEFTRTDDGKSLSDVTNFLPAKAREDEAHAILFGVAFGF